LLALSFPAVAAAQAPEPGTVINREYDLKAVFLYKFTHYVRWPGMTFATIDEPFIIGVLGRDPFGEVLDRIAATQKFDGRAIKIRRWRSVEELGPCHILFLSRSLDAKQQQAALAALQNRHVLIVGETPDFCRQGGVIGFFIAENNLRVEVNLAAAKREQLTINSGLLKLAKVSGKE
jgi:hypothetical protein